jgi:hypothetical protein
MIADNNDDEDLDYCANNTAKEIIDISNDWILSYLPKFLKLKNYENL